MSRVKLTTVSVALVAALATVAAGTSGAAPTKTVKVKDSKFSPKALSVKKGTRVTWVWSGDLPHDVIGSGPAKFRSKIKSTGKYSTVLKKPGKYKIICSLHKSIGMTATITVK